ncbi:MAG: sodium:calcium antiporter [Candidatus Micrarchaeota archaeon]
MYELVSALALLAVGLIIVFKSAEKSIDHALRLSKLAGISEFAVGFLLFSVATSLPELVVGISSAFRGSTDLGVGNVFGANIINVTLVLGVAAYLGVVEIRRNDIKELVLILLGTSLVSMLFIVYQPGRLSGAALFLLFLAYAYRILTTTKNKPAGGQSRKFSLPSTGVLFRASAPFAFWIALVIIGAQIAVENAIRLSALLGIAQTVIGATLVSLGTSLPEMSVSVTAALRGKAKVAVGNAVGSAIVNLSLVFGTALMINPVITFAPAVRLIAFSVIANMLLLYFIVVRGSLHKRDGLLLILGYIAFFILQYAGG